MNPYESSALLDQYLLFHYASPDEIAPPPGTPEEALAFPVATARYALAAAPAAQNALDLGCAVGRSAFELSTAVPAVTAIDYSASFIAAAQKLQAGETLPYQRLEEGRVTTPLEAACPAGANPDRLSFQTGDAMELPAGLGTFDLVHAANLICRLPEPGRLLDRLPALVNPGGHLVITTPCTWLDDFTPTKNWPDLPTLQWLQAKLTDTFELLDSRDFPFLIRETARKFQSSVAEGSLWRRRTG